MPVSEANVETLQRILKHGQLWSFSHGRATRMEWFNTHHEAMEAAGVRE